MSTRAELSHLNPDRIARAVSLAGGGARGVFTASVVAELERRLGCDFPEQFDVFVGTSVGGLLALGLACGVSGRRLSEYFAAHVNEAFERKTCLSFRGILRPKYHVDGLKQVVSQLLGADCEKKLSALDRNVLVTSVDVRTNRIVYFCNRSRVGQIECLSDISVMDAALATSAAPSYFPSHHAAGGAFVDGGLVSNNPDLEALRFCLSALSRSASAVSILSVGTGRVMFSGDVSRTLDAGLLEWLRGLSLVDRIMSLQEGKASDIVSVLLGEMYCRLDARLEIPIALDDVRRDTIVKLQRHGEEVAGERWAADPARLSQFVR